ncbi:MAG: rod shape-determining protein MreD [Candidatus Omnitrophota bacterium]
MINILLGVISLWLLLFQLAYPYIFSLFGTRPDFLLIIIIFLSLYSRLERTFFWAVLLGGFKDLTSLDIFAINIFSYSLISLIMANFSLRFNFRDRISMLFIFVFSVSFLTSVFAVSLHMLFSHVNYGFTSAIKIIFLQGLLTACWAMLIIPILKKCALRLFISQS